MFNHAICLYFITLLLCVILTACSTANLLASHLPFVLTHHGELCKGKNSCPAEFHHKKLNGHCWGYESNCSSHLQYGRESHGCKTKREKEDFWKMVDFGYVKERRDEMQILCKSTQSIDSYLHCSRYTRYCRARNLYLNFSKLWKGSNTDKFREDLFQPGDIGGFCQVNKSLLEAQGEHKSPLQSWFGELQHYTQLEFIPAQEPSHCDLTINQTVMFMKLDFGGNMFHHFCDFFNLYVSQHLNDSTFDRDIRVVMWDTATASYFDLFSSSWKVFTQHPVIPLMEWKGKRVCIRDVMFPLLPRMRRGMFYNTYVPGSCVGSNLFRAFSEHFLHRMQIPLLGPLVVDSIPKVKVTLLQRGSPEKEKIFRQIKNQNELTKQLEELSYIELKVVQYEWKTLSFEKQLEITRNSDVFIGMHGAGLTHFLFLPDWAVAFELYNCGDKHCYSDLARLRGLHYITWPTDPMLAPTSHDQGKHSVYGDNPKFWNWSFDPSTFRQLVEKAVEYVLQHPQYVRVLEEKSQRNLKAEL